MRAATSPPETDNTFNVAGPGWLRPIDFELGLLTEDGQEFGSAALGPRDFLAPAHCALRAATAAGVVAPGTVCRVAGVQAAQVQNGRGGLAVREWYLALTAPGGELAAIRSFEIAPFASRACREALVCGRDPAKTMFTLRTRTERPGARLGQMTVAADIPLGPAPDVNRLTLIGDAPLTTEPVYIWPEPLLRQFRDLALQHPEVEVLAGVLGRPCWAEVKANWRILIVTVREIVPVPLALCAPTKASVNLNRPVADYVRAARAASEERRDESLYDLGTLHSHLPVRSQDDSRPPAAARSPGAVGAFFSIADAAAMTTKFYLPYQSAMIFNVPENASPCAGRDLAAQFQQWCWSTAGTVMASTGFYLEEGK